MSQPYPSSSQVPPAGRPKPPSSVMTAVRLMYAGAAVSAVSLIIGVATLSNLKTALRQHDPSLTPAQANTLASAAIGFGVAVGVIGIGLWLWMAWASKAGKGWARVASSVFFGLDTLVLLYGLARGGASVSDLTGIIPWLIGLAAVVTLWRPDASEYFSRAARP
jgi:uncharacterized membrane protein (DUF2068 family)